MITSNEKGIMLYIIKHCKRIEEKIDGLSEKNFLADADIKDIVCFNVLQIGELVKGLSPAFLSQYNKMPWKDIKGMRDWVAHGYGTISFDEVWKTASKDVIPLRKYCEAILKENK